MTSSISLNRASSTRDTDFYIWFLTQCMWGGGALHTRRIGYHILDLQHDGRWTKASTALESYTQLNLVAMQPEKVMRDKPKYIRTWTFALLAFITQNTIQLPGGGVDHIHTKVMQEFFPNFYKACHMILPKWYPSLKTLNKLVMRYHNRKNEVFIKKVQVLTRKARKLHHLRSQFSLTWQRAVLNRASHSQLKSLKAMQMMHEAMATREDATVQVTPSTAEKGTQTPPVQIIPLPTSTPMLEDPPMLEVPQEEDRLWDVQESDISLAFKLLQTAELHFQQAQTGETAELHDIGAEIDLLDEGVAHALHSKVPTPGDIYRGTTEDFNSSSTEEEGQIPSVTPEVNWASGSKENTQQSMHILRMGRKEMALSEEQIQAILDHQVDPSTVKESAIGYKGEPTRSHTTPYHESWDKMKQSCAYMTSARFSQSYCRLTQLQCNFSRIRGRLTKDPMYSHKVDGVLQAFTKEEYKEKFPGAKPISTMARSSTNLTKKLRHRFSKRYREHLDNLHVRARANREYKAGRCQKPAEPLKAKMP